MSISGSRRIRFCAAIGLIVLLVSALVAIASFTPRFLAINVPFFAAALIAATMAAERTRETSQTNGEEYFQVIRNWIIGRKQIDYLLVTAVMLTIIATTTSCSPF
ncbi:MAG: hypothetical protein ACM3NH_04160 [Candidatus Saccharibacteria bacterium]